MNKRTETILKAKGITPSAITVGDLRKYCSPSTLFFIVEEKRNGTTMVYGMTDNYNLSDEVNDLKIISLNPQSYVEEDNDNYVVCYLHLVVKEG